MIEREEDTGRFFYVTEGHRTSFVPGLWSDAGAWVPTDVSWAPQEVQDVTASIWTADVIAAWQAAHPWTPPPSPALADLQPYQFRAMLELSGKADALNSFIAAMPDPQKTIAQAKLDYSLVFSREDSLVLAAQEGLNLSEADLDSLWEQAAAIH